MKGRQRQKKMTFRLNVWKKLLPRQKKVLLGEQGGSDPGALLLSLPAREDASFLVACQLCLDCLWKWIKSKLSDYAPKKDKKHLHQGWCNGCPVQFLCVDSLNFATGCLTAHIATSTATSFSLEKGSGLTQYSSWHFRGLFRARIHQEKFCRQLGKAKWHFKIEVRFLDLAKVPGITFLFASSYAELLSCDITAAAPPPAKLLAGFERKTAFWSENAVRLFQMNVMNKWSWLGGWDQGASRANGSWYFFMKRNMQPLIQKIPVPQICPLC